MKNLSNANKSKHIVRNSLLLMLLIALAGYIFFLFCFLPKLSRQRNNLTSNSESRKYHLIVTGNAESLPFLTSVYQSAQKISRNYDTILELYVPGSKAEDQPLQTLLDYAGFVNASGVIAYLPENCTEIQNPVDLEGNLIPIFAMGHQNPDFPMISYIGNNFSETGRIIAGEAISLSDAKSKIVVICSSNENNTNFSGLVTNLQNKLKNSSYENYLFLDQDSKTNFSALRTLILKNQKQNFIFVTLTEQDTIQASQFKDDSPCRDNIKIIGLSDDRISRMYLEKGTITELISMDLEKLGEAAVKEFYEYKTTGYANRLITADLKIWRSK